MTDRRQRWLFAAFGCFWFSALAFSVFFVAPAPLRGAPDHVVMVPLVVSVALFAFAVFSLARYLRLIAR